MRISPKKHRLFQRSVTVAGTEASVAQQVAMSIKPIGDRALPSGGARHAT
jgi:hypothetical protein